tara:strand:+ start:1219 stop:1521 length:303 start_codon:yes stop_codon:yes gene_type:complete
MGGNNEHIYTVYSRTFSRVDSSEFAGSSSNRTFTSFHLDQVGDSITNYIRQSREVGFTEVPNLQARGYLLATKSGSSGWVASLNMEEAWSDHPEGIRWLP